MTTLKAGTVVEVRPQGFVKGIMVTKGPKGDVGPIGDTTAADAAAAAAQTAAEQAQAAAESAAAPTEDFVASRIPAGGAITTALDTRIEQVVILAENHGIVGDWSGGVSGHGTNDTAAIQALCDAAPAGAAIQFTKGKTYRFDSLTITKALTLDFAGADLVVKPWDGIAATATPAVWFKGQAGTSRGVATVASGAASVTLTTPADAAEFGPGDWVELFDDHAMTTWNGGTLVGQYQMSRVLTSDTSTGIVTLSIPAEWTYDTNPRIKLLTMLERPEVCNIGTLREIDPGVTYPEGQVTSPNLIQFDFCRSPRITRTAADGVNLITYQFSFCVDAVTEHTEARNAFRPSNGGHGYHTRFLVCHNSEARKARAQSMRHTVDYVRSYDCGSVGCETENTWSSAYFMHGYQSKRSYSTRDSVRQPADTSGISGGWGMGNGSFDADFGFTITSPTYYGAGQAFSMVCRAQDMRVLNPDVTTPSKSFQMICGAGGLTVIGGKVRLTAPAATSFGAGNGVLNAFATLSGVTLSIGDVTFDGVTFEGASTSLRVEGGRVLRFIRNRHVSPSMDYSGSACFSLVATSSGAHPDVVEIEGNYLDGGAVRNHINTNGITPTRYQKFTFNKAVAGMVNGLTANITANTKIYGNDFRQANGTSNGGISLTGDVSAAKSGGAVVNGNYPTTYDGDLTLVASNANFDSATNGVNVNSKLTGKMYMCLDHAGGSRPHWASGTSATSVWKNADGTTAHTPA